MMTRSTKQRACRACNERHLKCDQDSDICANCRKADRPCNRGPVFKFKDLSDSKIHRPRRRRRKQSRDDSHEHRKSEASQASPAAPIAQTDINITPLSGGIPLDTLIPEDNHPGPAAGQIGLEDSQWNLNTVVSLDRLETDERNADSLINQDPWNLHGQCFDFPDSGSLTDVLTPSGTFLFQNPPVIIGLPLAAAISSAAHPPASGMDASASNIGDSSRYCALDTTDNYSPQLPAPPRHESTKERGHVENNSNHPASDELPSDPDPDTQLHPRQRDTPLQTHEAHLMKFFMQTWGPLLDCNDPDRNFAVTVPQLALTKAPCLLYAILTIAALQLSRVSDYPINAAKQYRQQCGRSLVPVLQDLNNHELEGAIFTTYVLLRVYDQMTVALLDRSPETLYASSLALSTSPWYAYADKDGSLKRAAFWVHVREDIHVALFLQHVITIDHMLFHQNMDEITRITAADLAGRQHQHSQAQASSTPGGRSAAAAAVDATTPRPAIECAWSNHIIGLTCNVINFCFRSPRRSPTATWAALLAKVECWNVEKPVTFAPFHEQAPRPELAQFFPRLWLRNDWHVMGLLYYHISLILLKSHRPGQQTSYIATSYGKGEIIHHTRVLCGIVLANPIAQALIVACHMVNVAGGFLEAEGERNEVLQLLYMARDTTGWPVAEVEKRLKKAWGKASAS